MENQRLRFAVFQIGDSQDPRVAEYRACQLEGDPMFAKVRGSLDFVPLELKLLFHYKQPLSGNELQRGSGADVSLRAEAHSCTKAI